MAARRLRREATESRTQVERPVLRPAPIPCRDYSMYGQIVRICEKNDWQISLRYMGKHYYPARVYQLCVYKVCILGSLAASLDVLELCIHQDTSTTCTGASVPAVIGSSASPAVDRSAVASVSWMLARRRHRQLRKMRNEKYCILSLCLAKICQTEEEYISLLRSFR